MRNDKTSFWNWRALKELQAPLLWLRKTGSRLASVRANRRLRVSESLPLGEKRFVALIECDDQRFLIAGTAQNISLLATLDAKPCDFADALKCAGAVQ